MGAAEHHARTGGLARPPLRKLLEVDAADQLGQSADVEVGVRIAEPRVAVLRPPAWQHERPAEGACESDGALEATELVAHAGKRLVDEIALASDD